MKNSFTVIYDANVLYPAPLRDILMELCRIGLFRARWSEEIHQEWIRNVHQDNQIPLEKLNKVKELMNKASEGSLVVDHLDLVECLSLPDPDDRHVLAAAIKCNADAIVTFNLKDFPNDVLTQYEIEAIHPDDFITDLFDLCAPKVLQTMRKHRARLKNPPLTPDDYIQYFAKQGLTNTVRILESYKLTI